VSENGLTKADIIEAIQAQLGLSRKVTAEVVDDVFDTVKKTLISGESVKVSGFGNFEVRHKDPRRGRNPKTGEELTIEARNVIRFKPSQVLRKALNNK
jgi:integration host factor subunit alpha